MACLPLALVFVECTRQRARSPTIVGDRGAVLDRLRAAEKTGSIVVNSPDAIRNTYRHRMVELFARHHVSAPASRIIASEASGPRPPTEVWVKRYDFHATPIAPEELDKQLRVDIQTFRKVALAAGLIK